jgi:hypothetical protein
MIMLLDKTPPNTVHKQSGSNLGAGGSWSSIHDSRYEDEHAMDEHLIPASSASAQTRDKVFISYSHADKRYLEELQTHLRPHIDNEQIAVWADTQIRPGERWRERIELELASAKVAVLLVSADFLASSFISERELPRLLAAAQSEGVAILWIPIRASSFEVTAIGAYQAVHPPERPIAGLPPPQRAIAWVKICKAIVEEYHR